MSLVFNILLVLISFTQLLISVQSAKDIKPEVPKSLEEKCEWMKTISEEDERLLVIRLVCEDDNLTPEHRACIRKSFGVDSQGRSVAEVIKVACSPPEPMKHLNLDFCFLGIGWPNAHFQTRVKKCVSDARNSNNHPGNSAGRPSGSSGGSNRVPSEASGSNQLLVSIITTVLIVFIGGIVVGISH